MFNFTKSHKRISLRLYFFLVASVCFCDIAKAQLSTIHYLPPLYGRDESIIQRHYILVSNPDLTRIANVLILDGSGNILFNEAVGNGQTLKANLGNGTDANGIISTDELNTIISQDDNLLVQSDIPVYVQIRHTVNLVGGDERDLHGLMMSSKGDWAIGNRFRCGFGFSSNSSLENLVTPNGRSDFISVMATEDNTRIVFNDLRQRVNLGGYFNSPSSFDIILQGGESYTIAHFPRSDNANLALNGALVTSDKPIVVNCGSWALDHSPLDNVNHSQRECAAEQIIPVNRLHSEYVVMNVDGVELAEKVIIVGDQDGTQYFFNGNNNPEGTVNAGEFVVINKDEFSDFNNLYIETSVPTPIYQTTGLQHYSVGYTIITPLKCWGTQSTVIPRMDADFVLEDSRINIVAPRGTNINVNGGTLGGSEPILGNSDYVTHRVTPVVTDDIFITSDQNIQVMTSFRSFARGAATYYSEYFQTDTLVVEQVCPGESYTVGDNEYSSTGLYVDTLRNVNGCDSVVTLDLEVYETELTIIEEAICDGDSFNFFGQDYSTSGQYPYSLSTYQGCDSTVMLDLQILEPSFDTFENTICYGSRILGLNIESDTIFNYTISGANSCDSTTTYIFDVLDNFEANESYEICPEDNILVNGIYYSEEGIYYDTLTAQNGCDSTVIIELNHFDNTPISTLVEVCEGDNYNNFIINQDTTIIASGATSNGCAQDIFINVEVLYPSVFLQSFISCPGESYAGNTFYGDTIIVEELQGGNGCDSVAVTTILIETFTSLDTVYLNSGDEFLGTVYYENDLVDQDLQNIDGCDSLAITQIIINPVLSGIVIVDLCPGDSYDTNTYYSDSTYTSEHTASNGFDSITVYNVFVHNTFQDTLEYRICDGDSLWLNGNYESEEGYYEQGNFSIWGCDSITISKLIIDPNEVGFDRMLICEGDSVLIGGMYQSEAGVYAEAYNTYLGCDSLVDVQVEVILNVEESLSFEFCENEMFNGINLTGDTLLIEHFTSAAGCDSVVYTEIHVEFPYEFLDTIYVFEDEGFEGDTLLVDSMYTFLGCDSVLLTQVILLPSVTTINLVTLCEGEEFNSIPMYSDTIIVENLTAVNGADSIAVTSVIVLFDSASQSEIVLCEGEQYNGIVYMENAVLTSLLSNADGCDSLVSTIINIIPPIEDDTLVYIIEGESYEGEIYENDTLLIDYLSTLENGCDSTYYTQIIILPHVFTSDTISICESYTYQDIVINSDTLFIQNLTSWTGSDSIHYTYILTLPFNFEYETITICEYESVFIGGSLQNETGEYIDTILSSIDCPLIRVTALEVVDTIVRPYYYSACEGEVIPFQGDEIFEDEIITQNITNSNGCIDSEVHHFNFYENTSHNLFEEICFGGSYDFNGEILSEAGEYQQNLISSNSCDSLLTLNLSIADPFEFEIDPVQSYCEGDNTEIFAGNYSSYEWSNGETSHPLIVDDAGYYEVTVTDADGCIGMANINVPPPNIVAMDLNLLQPDCLEQDYGSLSILQPLGSSNLNYTLNSQLVSSDDIFNELSPGNYEIIATDDLGCSEVQSFSIQEFVEPYVRLNAEALITLGDSTLLRANTNANPIERIEWEPNLYLSCDDCLSPYASPPNDFTWTVTIYTTEGCIIMDHISLKVEKNYAIYIPNGFSPNADGINDHFTVYAGGAVDRIQSLQVYDRWGDKVFFKEDFPHSVDSEGWDGTFRGKKMQPGVFVYYAEILLLTGEVILEKGDVTLVE